MKDNQRKLFLENYNNLGDCKDLLNFIKTIKINDKYELSYLSWAYAEKIFRLQGGEIINPEDDKLVLVENIPYTENQINEGEMVEVQKSKQVFFTKIHIKWQELELIEYYPIFNTKNQPITNPNQMDINKSRQRGLVKAIARLTGIGLKLFEKEDLDEEETNNVVSTPIKKPTTKIVKETKEKEVKVAPLETLKEIGQNTLIKETVKQEEIPNLTDLMQGTIPSIDSKEKEIIIEEQVLDNESPNFEELNVNEEIEQKDTRDYNKLKNDFLEYYKNNREKQQEISQVIATILGHKGVFNDLNVEQLKELCKHFGV